MSRVVEIRAQVSHAVELENGCVRKLLRVHVVVLAAEDRTASNMGPTDHRDVLDRVGEGVDQHMTLLDGEVGPRSKQHDVSDHGQLLVVATFARAAWPLRTSRTARASTARRFRALRLRITL